MFTNEVHRRDGLRRARECALGLLACWLLVQNLVLFAALLGGGLPHAWSPVLPVLGVAFALMLPLWLVPVAVLMVAAIARRARTDGVRCRADDRGAAT